MKKERTIKVPLELILGPVLYSSHFNLLGSHLFSRARLVFKVIAINKILVLSNQAIMINVALLRYGTVNTGRFDLAKVC